MTVAELIEELKEQYDQDYEVVSYYTGNKVVPLNDDEEKKVLIA